jgi:uncharacterized protein (UPF0332 family)
MSEEDRFLEMASSSLSDAKLVINESDRLFWNALYYSLFYAAKAAVKSEGIEASTHSGLDSQVGRKLYKENGDISAEEASFYSDIRRIREEMDYEPFTQITRNKKTAVEKAEKLVNKLREVANK